MITPTDGNVLIKVDVAETVWASSQDTYEERGEVLGVGSESVPFKVGDFVYFDSWRSARYKDSQGAEFWMVPVAAIRAYES